MVELVFGCVTSHCKFVGGEFSSDAVNCTVCAGVTPTGTVAVACVIDTRMPESSVITVVPVFFVSAFYAAVNVIVGTGLGNLDKGGAVYVITVVCVSGLLNVP